MTQLAWDWGAEAPRLRQANPALWPVDASWQAEVDAFWISTIGQALLAFLQARLTAGATIYPPEPLRALSLTPLSRVKVVILGQDPYHGPGQAEGLAFSVAPGVKIPPSLRNMFKELHRSLGVPLPVDGSLVRWTRQGVLLLNTTLTVEEGQAASHARWGWEVLTDTLVGLVAARSQPTVFMLWGGHAQAKRSLIERAAPDGRHLVLQANHPSPLSALRPPQPFLGCEHFLLANRFLQAKGLKAIDW